MDLLTELLLTPFKGSYMNSYSYTEGVISQLLEDEIVSSAHLSLLWFILFISRNMVSDITADFSFTSNIFVFVFNNILLQ